MRGSKRVVLLANWFLLRRALSGVRNEGKLSNVLKTFFVPDLNHCSFVFRTRDQWTSALFLCNHKYLFTGIWGALYPHVIHLLLLFFIVLLLTSMGKKQAPESSIHA